MLKRMLLCVGLMSSVGNVQADLALDKVLKGAFILAGGAWAAERFRNSYNDWRDGNHQPASFLEDIHNVIATTACITMFAHVGGASTQSIRSLLGSGLVLGTVFVGAKCVCPGAKELRLREFIGMTAAAGLGRAMFEQAGIPIMSFSKP